MAREDPPAMKLKIDLDCTPKEAREFLGLPDLKPVQAALLEEAQARMTKALGAMDPETMLKTWLPATLEGFEQLREAFLRQLGSGKR
jgi:hypothetical protein